VFDGTKTEVLHIPVQQRIYVIEDIDAMKSVVVKRQAGMDASEATLESEASPEEKFKEQMRLAEMNPGMFMSSVISNKGVSSRQVVPVEPARNAMDLSTLLNVLDGTLEVPGRIIIITTNYPEKLDSALIRPGRIDLTLEYGRCSVEILKEMLSSFYETTEGLELSSELEGKWTPAEVTQILFKHFGNLEASIRDLEFHTPTSLYKYSYFDTPVATIISENKISKNEMCGTDLTDLE